MNDKLIKKAQKFNVSLTKKNHCFLRISSANTLIDNLKKVMFDNNLKDMDIYSSTIDHIQYSILAPKTEQEVRSEIADIIRLKRCSRPFREMGLDYMKLIGKVNDNDLVQIKGFIRGMERKIHNLEQENYKLKRGQDVSGYQG